MALLAGTAAPSPAAGLEQRAVGPEINAYYANPDFDRWRATFERSGREVFDRRAEILAATGVRPGWAVADVGAGTGLFTLLIARAVQPDGTVFAVDISPGFVDGILQRAQGQGLENVRGVVNSQTDVRLADGSIDLAFACDTYHHFEYPASMLASLWRALRPGGYLVLIDYRRAPGVNAPWVLGHVRAGRDQVVREVTEAGFELADEQDLLRESYFLRFRKPVRTMPSASSGD